MKVDNCLKIIALENKLGQLSPIIILGVFTLFQCFYLLDKSSCGKIISLSTQVEMELKSLIFFMLNLTLINV